MKVESEKADLKLNIQKTKIVASGLITLWKKMGQKWKQWKTFFTWAPKSVLMVIATIKLEEACSLVEKLWPT